MAAADMGADFIGIVLAPARRQVPTHKARRIISDAKRTRPSVGTKPLVVGVFVNEPVNTINDVAEYCGLDWVQLSGGEPLEQCKGIERPIIKAVHVMADTPPEELLPELSRTLEEIHSLGYMPLLDSAVRGHYGGTGQSFNWQVAQELASKYPLILSGGLTPANVDRAAKMVQPWGVDVSSGVEVDGSKDVDKMRAFVQAVRETEGSSRTDDDKASFGR